MDPEITWIQRSKDRWWKIGGRHQILTLHFWGNHSFSSCLALNSAALFWGLFVGTTFQGFTKFGVPRCFSETNSGWGSFSSFTSVNSWEKHGYGTTSANKKNKTKRSDVRVMCFGKGDGTSEHDTWRGKKLMKFICCFFFYLRANLQSLYRTAQVVATNFWLRGKTLNSSCTGKHNFQVKEAIKTNINL